MSNIVDLDKIRMNNILKTDNFQIITSGSEEIDLTTDYTYFNLENSYSLDGSQNTAFTLSDPTESIPKILKKCKNVKISLILAKKI